jgi:ribosome-associated toxin RatA of RatAB toxin-antitoxin module
MLRRFCLLCFLLGPVGALAAAAQTDPQAVSIKELDDSDQYYVHGVFLSPATPVEVFKVISDYEHLGGVLSSLRSSRVLSRNEGSLLVEQIMVGKFLFFRKAVRLLLRIQESSPWRIDFAEEGAGPFRSYSGSWQVEAVGGGSRVDYTLSASRGDLAPVFVERRLFRENSQKLLDELSGEVARRLGKTPLAVTTTPTPLGLALDRKS